MSLLYADYIHDYEVRSCFTKEFISLWPGWLGKDNLHKLDEVTEAEWERFNNLLRTISESYDLFVLDSETESIVGVDNINSHLDSYAVSMSKAANQFSRFVIPKLECVVTEEWDYTYIIWHKGNEAVESLSSLIHRAGLYNFSD